MDYEKKYKEALERAREYHSVDIDNTMDIKARGIMEYLFPELKESEDEKIRKELLTWLQNTEGQVLPMDRYNAALAWLEKQGEKIDIANKEYWRGYREGKKEILDKYAELEKQGEKEPTIEMKTPEESLGIDSNTYSEIVDECIYGEQKSQRMISAEAKEAMYAKTAWSEDDEKMLVDAYVMLDWYKGNNWWTARRIKDWLNSLKERIGG